MVHGHAKSLSSCFNKPLPSFLYTEDKSAILLNKRSSAHSPDLRSKCEAMHGQEARMRKQAAAVMAPKLVFRIGHELEAGMMRLKELMPTHNVVNGTPDAWTKIE